MEGRIYFSLFDYIIFFGFLLVSFVIGIVSAFKGNRSPEEYLLGNRSLNPISVSMSLVASFISAMTIVGTTTEIYLFGTQFIMITVGGILGIIISMQIFLPVIYPLKVTSICEYLELRFNSSRLQIFVMLLMYTNASIQMGITLYATSVALTAVTPLTYSTCILAMGLTCTVYSTIGGIRAVVWTDVFQMIVIVIGLLIFIVVGISHLGGIENLFIIANEGQRLQFFNMNPSITERYNFYNTVGYGLFAFGAAYSITPTYSQRVCAVKTIGDAKRVLKINIVGFTILNIIVCLGSLAAYASYAGCDPVLDGRIEIYNQIFSFYIIDKLGFVYGLPGIYAATLASGTISTISSTVNAQVAILWGDLFMKFKFFSKVKPVTCTLINKALSFFCGCLFIGLAFITAKAASIVQLSSTVFGISMGLIFGVFILGICFPISNIEGAVCGMFGSFVLLLWIFIGSLTHGEPPKRLPMSDEFCENYLFTNGSFNESDVSFNNTIRGIVSESGFNNTNENDSSSPLLYLYRMSFTLYIISGPILVVIIGLIVSYLTGRSKTNKVSQELVFQWSNIFYGTGKNQNPEDLKLSVIE